MEERRYKSSGSMPAITGASSLLVIFSVLCLTVFALLSLSTASANHSISQRNSKALAEYYQAEEEANRVLADLREGKAAEGVVKKGGEAEYSVRISDTKKLMVKVSLDDYSVLRWQEVSEPYWEPDEHIPVYTGK